MIKLWNLKNKSQIAVIDYGVTGLSSGISSIQYLGNGLLAGWRLISENEYSICIWDLNRNFQIQYEFKGYFTDLSFTNIADGFLWINQFKKVWDVENKVFYTLYQKSHDYFYKFIRINQTHFAGLLTQNIRIYSASNLTGYVCEYLLADRYPEDFYLVGEKYIAVLFGYFDFRIMILDVNNGATKCEFDADSHRNLITSITDIGNGLFASVARDALLKIWDINTCSLVHTFDNYENNLYNDQISKLVAIDGLFLASLSKYSVKLWDLNSLSLKFRFNNTEAGSDLVNNDLAYYKL